MLAPIALPLMWVFVCSCICNRVPMHSVRAGETALVGQRGVLLNRESFRASCWLANSSIKLGKYVSRLPILKRVLWSILAYCRRWSNRCKRLFVAFGVVLGCQQSANTACGMVLNKYLDVHCEFYLWRLSSNFWNDARTDLEALRASPMFSTNFFEITRRVTNVFRCSSIRCQECAKLITGSAYREYYNQRYKWD